MVTARATLVWALLACAPGLAAEDLGAMWGTAAAEAKYYPIVNIPIPSTIPMRPGGLEVLPDGRLAVGTRRGDIYFRKGDRIVCLEDFLYSVRGGYIIASRLEPDFDWDGEDDSPSKVREYAKKKQKLKEKKSSEARAEVAKKVSVAVQDTYLRTYIHFANVYLLTCT